MANSSLKLQGELGMLDIEEVNKQVITIDNQITNMNDTMNDFKDFFKPKAQSCYNVNDSISQVIRIIGKVYAIQKVNLLLNLSENCYTQGYSNELNQVIINILNNARDVILEKDTKVKDVVITTKKIDNTITIIIEDFAGGIPTNIINNIFEPYVTTKDDTHGTGIGLDMSKTIIEKVNGKIDAENYLTKVEGEDVIGARFTIKLKSC
ncbi:MAG: HAMP domain-containing sensor histidine kinase [Arcobacteraceae bacterium]|nr:HAMP domain-containing sensor histidine kinase [Arcobacteraceae bacterium]